LGAEDATAALLGERGRFAPFGVAGGEAGALNRFYYDTADGKREPPMASKITDILMKPGWRVRLETPGGGGYGNAADRPAEMSERDIRLGFVTGSRERRAGPGSAMGQTP